MVALTRANVHKNGIRLIDPGNQVSKKKQFGVLHRTSKIQFVVCTSILRNLQAIRIDTKVEVSIEDGQVRVDLVSVGRKLLQHRIELSIPPVPTSQRQDKGTGHYPG